MASMLRWMGLTLARFVGLAVTILGGWVIAVNLASGGYPGATLALIVTFGVFGVAGGLAYLFSFDGPARFRARWVRVIGWLGMLVSVLLPSMLTMMLVPLVLLVSPTLFFTPHPAPGGDKAITSE